MLEAVRTSKTSIYSNKTVRRYIPEGSPRHARLRKNLKPHKPKYQFLINIVVTLHFLLLTLNRYHVLVRL
jgi:hypothetical protein